MLSVDQLVTVQLQVFAVKQGLFMCMLSVKISAVHMQGHLLLLQWAHNILLPCWYVFMPGNIMDITVDIPRLARAAVAKFHEIATAMLSTAHVQSWTSKHCVSIDAWKIVLCRAMASWQDHVCEVSLRSCA